MQSILDQPIQTIPGVSTTVIRRLKNSGINKISDLLLFLPYRHEDFSALKKISEVTENEMSTIKGRIIDIRSYPGFGRKVTNRAEAIISDQSGSIKVVWFNQAYLAKTLQKGEEFFLSGIPRIYKTLQFQNPIYEQANESGTQIHTARILPVYHQCNDLNARTLRTAIYNCLEMVTEMPEYLPNNILKDLQLMEIFETLKNLHFPKSREMLEKAKRRMAFEEIFFAQLAVQKHKLKLETQKATAIPFNKHLVQNFLRNLPFLLTDDQKKALWEILLDLQNNLPMNRLLEGDVGSGKTIVAFTAALEVLNSGKKVVMLCPTEILAAQHYQNAIKYFENHPYFSIILYTSKNQSINNIKSSKNQTIPEINGKGASLIICTHAAFETVIQPNDCALVIIDEQHRFGVIQRAAILEKSKKRSHLLSMTATPIPRSLKLTLFGDLKISQIKNSPEGRKKIITRLVGSEQREAAYRFVKNELQKGRQALVITPLIEESNAIEIKSAKTEQANLQKRFKEFKVGLIHGKMKQPEKEKAMAEFLENKIQILVSTSLVEVGIDIANASVIIIEGAERFGLAQLHQLRGRVGRSEHQSYCFLFSESLNEKSTDRLEKFARIKDGFELAEIDLKTRGFGNIFGEQQSGFHYFNYFSFSDHAELAKQAMHWTKKILREDPELESNPLLKNKLFGKIIHLE